MYLLIRNKLPWLVAALWLWLSWHLWLGHPPFAEIGNAVRSVNYSGFEIFTWFSAMVAAMFLADRLWCEFARWRIGVDPTRVHWSRLRNRDGEFFCAQCLSPFLLPPEDLSPSGMVNCGDCGHAIAPYGEMQPLIDEQRHRVFARIIRSALRRLF